jgi:hypothetical protein
MQSNDERQDNFDRAKIDEDAWFQSLGYEERLKLIQDAMADLEREGRIKRTGEYRNGRPFYTLTESGTA